MASVNHQSKSAPIYVWGITLVFIGIVFAAVLFLYAGTKPFVEYNLERLDTFHSAKGKKIIGIGSSLLHNATFFDQFMSDFGKENGYDSIRFLRIIKYGSAIEDFVPLLDPMLNTSPDIIVIEFNMLFLLGGWARPPSFWNDMKKFIRFVIQHPTKVSDFQKAERGNLELSMKLPDRNARQDSSVFAKRVRKMKEFRVRNSGFPKELENFFSVSGGRKIKMVIVDVPGYTKLEEAIEEWSVNKQKMSDLQLELKIKYGIETLKFPDELGLEYYMDFSHFNQKGRERYSLWLLSCLSKL